MDGIVVDMRTIPPTVIKACSPSVHRTLDTLGQAWIRRFHCALPPTWRTEEATLAAEWGKLSYDHKYVALQSAMPTVLAVLADVGKTYVHDVDVSAPQVVDALADALCRQQQLVAQLPVCTVIAALIDSEALRLAAPRACARYSARVMAEAVAPLLPKRTDTNRRDPPVNWIKAVELAKRAYEEHVEGRPTRTVVTARDYEAFRRLCLLRDRLCVERRTEPPSMLLREEGDGEAAPRQ